MHTEEKSSFLWESVHMFLHRKKKDRWEEGVRVAVAVAVALKGVRLQMFGCRHPRVLFGLLLDRRAL